MEIGCPKKDPKTNDVSDTLPPDSTVENGVDTAMICNTRSELTGIPTKDHKELKSWTIMAPLLQ
jgi:hypothetical protein